ncbi:MAG: hypothetical protein U0807_05540 [Candidatus Binatia bacterium]
MTFRMRSVGAALVALLGSSGVMAETDFLVGYKLSKAPKVIGAATAVSDALAAQSCTFGKAQYLLVAGEFANGDDPRGGVPGRYVCFKAKCDQKPTLPVPLDTQMGTFTATAITTKLICAPEGPACTGTQVGGYCWYLGAAAESCTQTCAAAGRTYSTATESYAGSGGTEANCNAVLDALGVPAAPISSGLCSNPLTLAPLPAECSYAQPIPPYAAARNRCTNVPADPNAATPWAQRACACQ